MAPLAVGLSLVGALLPMGGAGATTDATAVRWSGSNRYGTAAAVAAQAFPDGAAAAVLVSGTNFPDGLAASALAGSVDGPVLLTLPDRLPSETESALRSVVTKGKAVWVIGGTSAVSTNVRDRLRALGYTLTEVSGADRYTTAAAVAARVAELKGIGSLRIDGELRKTALLVTGSNFPDAIAAGPLAAAARLPILLTSGTALSPATESALTSLDIEHVVTIGGRSAVSRDVTLRVEQLGLTVERIAGDDRDATAAAVADRTAKPIDAGGAGFFRPTGNQVIIVSGSSFADALSASALGRALPAPVLVAGGVAARAFFVANASYVDRVVVVGGTGAVPGIQVNDALAGLEAVPDPVVTATITARAGETSFSVLFGEAMAANGTITVAGGSNRCATITEFTGILTNPTAGCYLGSGGELAVVVLSSPLTSGTKVAVSGWAAAANGARTVIPTTITVA